MRARLEHLPADVLGLSPLARAALAQGPRFALLAVARAPREVPRPEERPPWQARTQREALVRRIAAGLAPLEPPGRVHSSLQALAREGTFAIVSGQQPGLFCAPLYSLYKALQACRLAHELSGEWGTPVVPIFWNHADDHDVAEVHHAYQLNRNLDLQKIGLAGMSSGRQPISRLVLDEEHQRLGAIRGSLAQMYEEHAHTEEALELFVPRAGETLARAMTRAFTELLGEHGLVVLEPDWVREELSHALAELVAAGPVRALAAGSEDVRAAGLEPAIDPAAAALVYHVGAEGRRALRAGGDGLRYDGESGSRTEDELAAEILQGPHDWSAGALLRPLVQDAVLPVAAYVGGFGELGYLVQLAALRDAAGVPRTAFAPRVTCSLIDAETRAALAKTGLELREVLARRGALEELAPEVERPAVLDAIARAAEAGAAGLLEHRAELAELDPALGANLARAASQGRALVDKLVEKAERVHANKSGKGRRQLRRLSNTLFPRGAPQERVLGPLQFTARYGRAWIEALYAELPALSSEHLVVHLEEDA